MKKIGIITLFEGNYNYGAVLQAYALESFLEKSGYDCEIIRYLQPCKTSNKNNGCLQRIKNKIIKTQSLGEIVYELQRFLYKKKIDADYEEILSSKKHVFNQFIDKYLSCSDLYDDLNISGLNEKYDIFVCGSDQIWKPECSCDAYFLKFVNDEKLKIAYAPSIGVGSLTDEEKSYMRPLLERLNAISVREQKGKEILDTFVNNKEISVVVDPTILIDREFWMNEVKNDPLVNQDYVFTYFLSPNYCAMKKIKQIANENNFKVVSIAYNSGKHVYTEKFCDIRLHDVGPSEFLNLIKNAKCVFTDSFHASVFSIIYNINFYALDRITDTKKQNMSSRITTLLNDCSLQNHLINAKEINGKLINNENQELSDNYTLLKGKQQYSRKYLDNALKNKKSE